MKVTLRDQEILEYSLIVAIENNGEEVLADIRYNGYDGYVVYFYDNTGNKIDYPQWAKEIEENGNPEPLGYLLEENIGGFFRWTNDRKDRK